MHISADTKSRECPPLLRHRPLIRPLLMAALLAVCAAFGRPPAVFSAPQRRPGDSLAVSFERASRVFGSQEIVRLTATVTSRKPGVARESTGKQPPRLEWQLVPYGGTKAVASGEVGIPLSDDGNVDDISVEILLPKVEGVYCVKLASLGRRVVRAECEVQLVVVDSQRPAANSPTETSSKMVDSFDPATGGVFRRISLDASGKKPAPAFARLLKLPRSENDSKPQSLSELSATAYRIRVAHPGRPHLVELICRPDQEQHGSLCLIEGDARGQFSQLGPECLFVVGSPTARYQRLGSSPETHIHRQIFWPNDREPALVVAGRQAGRPLEVSRVQVYELGDRLATPESSGQSREAEDGAASQHPRLIGVSLNQRDLLRNFCGPRPTDSAHRALGDDWQTSFMAALRLIEFLHYQRQNALLLGVSVPSKGAAAESGELARPEELSPTPEDVLELLLRLFDREGLLLIPELRFDGPLAAIDEVSSETSVGAEDFHLVRGAGTAHSDLETAVAQYNPLSSQVQQAVQDVVAGLLSRCADHSSFGGVAFRLGSRSCLQFPGLEWGYDAATVRRFEQSTRARIPRSGADAAAEARQVLTTTARREWVRFRAAEIASFHRRLVEQIVDARPDARVIFSGQDLSGEVGNAAAGLVGFIRAGTNPARLLAEQGLDFSLPPYATDSHVSVLRPVARIEADDPIIRSAAASFNSSLAVDALYRGASPGGRLHLLRPQPVPPLFESVEGSTCGLVSAPGNLDSPRSIDGRYSQLLAGLDAQVIFDGDDAIPLLPAMNSPKVPPAIGRLPGIPFRAAGPQVPPVVVRSGHVETSTWIYVVNSSTLRVTVELLIDCPATTAVRSLVDGECPTFTAIPGKKSRVRVELAENDLWAVEIDRPDAAVSETQVIVSDDVLAEIKQRIDNLHANMKRAARARAKSPADNRGNAPLHDTQQAGWETQIRQGDSFDGDEVRQLTKTVSSVKLAWEEGRYSDCQRMLDGYWGQLLLNLPAPSAPEPLPRPKLADKLRDKLKR